MKEFIFINSVPENYSASDAQTVMPEWNALTAGWKTADLFFNSYVFLLPV